MFDSLTLSYDVTVSPNDTVIVDQEEAVFDKKDFSILLCYYVFSVLGFPGNILTIVVLMSSAKLREKTINMILVPQAVIDSIVCLASLLEEFMAEYSLHNLAKPFICHYIATKNISAFSMYASSYNVVLLSIERCYAILKPLDYDSEKVKRRLLYLFALDWMFSIFIMCLSPATVIMNDTCYAGYKLFTKNYFQYYSANDLVFGICLPVLISVICYSAMFRVLRQSAKLCGKDSKSGSVHKMRLAQMNIFKTCVIVVVVFIICWSIPESALFLKSINYYKTLNNTHFSLGRVAVILNSCINPYI